MQKDEKLAQKAAGLKADRTLFPISEAGPNVEDG